MRDSYPNTLAEQERSLLQRRRTAIGGDNTKGGVGVGLSGGGYFGAFLGQLFRRPGVTDSVDDVEALLAGRPCPAAERTDNDPGTPRVHRDLLAYLRENGRYLAPRGAGDVMLAAAVLLRNLISVHLVLALFVLLVLILAQLAYLPAAPVTPWPVSPYLGLTALVLVFAAWPAAWAYWLIGHPVAIARRELMANLGPPVLLLVVSLAALATAAIGASPTALPALGLAGSLVAAITLAIFLATDRALVQRLQSDADSGRDDSAVHVALARNRVSRGFQWALVTAAALLAVGLVDTAGGALVAWGTTEVPTGQLAAMAATLGAILAAVQRLAARLFPTTDDRPAIPLAAAAMVLATGLIAVYLVLMAALAHGITGAHAALAAADPGAARPELGRRGGRPPGGAGGVLRQQHGLSQPLRPSRPVHGPADAGVSGCIEPPPPRQWRQLGPARPAR